MNFNFMALIKSKIFWANILGLAVAVGSVFGVAPEMTGKVAEYSAAGIMVLNIILRMFANGSNSVVKLSK